MHTDAGERAPFDQLLVTLPTRLFASSAAGAAAEPSSQRYPGPEHYGAHVLILGLDRTLVPGVYWLNINDRDLPFLALVEHTNFLPPADYGGLHLVYLGNYLPMDHPLFGQSDEEVLDMFLPRIARIRPELRSQLGQAALGVSRAVRPADRDDRATWTRCRRTARRCQACTWPTWPTSTPRTAARTTACAWANAWLSSFSRAHKPRAE